MLLMSDLSKDIYRQLEEDKKKFNEILQSQSSEEKRVVTRKCLEEIEFIQQCLEEGEYVERISKEEFEELFNSRKYSVAMRILDNFYCKNYYFIFKDEREGYYFYTYPVEDIM